MVNPYQQTEDAIKALTPEDIKQAATNLAAPSWQDGFNAALAAFVANRTGDKVTGITSFQDSTYEAGYCDTCSYTQYEVTIYYTYQDGDYSGSGSYDYLGRFSELLNELLGD
jgi:hypothetical protein